MCLLCSVPSGFSQPGLSCSSESVGNRKLVHVRYPCTQDVRYEVHSTNPKSLHLGSAKKEAKTQEATQDGSGNGKSKNSQPWRRWKGFSGTCRGCRALGQQRAASGSGPVHGPRFLFLNFPPRWGRLITELQGREQGRPRPAFPIHQIQPKTPRARSMRRQLDQKSRTRARPDRRALCHP